MTGSEILGVVLSVLSWLPSKIKTSKPKPGIHILSYPMYGYHDIGYESYEGVEWLLQYPNPDPLGPLSFEPAPSPSERASALNIKGPYCPACRTKLSQSKTSWKFWGKYGWRCDNCGFKKRSRKSAFEVKEAAERVFEAELRKEFERMQSES